VEHLRDQRDGVLPRRREDGRARRPPPPGPLGAHRGAVGFLGGYTTFSTFGQETHDLLVESHQLLAVTNVVASCVLGVAAVVAGAAVGRTL